MLTMRGQQVLSRGPFQNALNVVNGSRQADQRPKSNYAAYSWAVGQNQWYHFGVGAPPMLVYFRGDWDVHWGYGLLTHGQISAKLVQKTLPPASGHPAPGRQAGSRQPTNPPTDRLTERPTNRPTDRPTDRPTNKPPVISQK